MIRLPNRPYLGLLALLRAGVVFCAIGLIGVGLVAYAPQYAALGWFLIGLGGAVGGLVFCGVVAGGIVHEHERIDEQEQRNAEKADLEIERRRLDLDAARAALAGAADDQPDPEPQRRAAWDAANITLFVGGDKAGSFSQPKMSSMISSDPWQAWTDFYAANPADNPVLVRVPGKVGTRLAFRWPLTRVLFAIRSGELPTPPGPPPSVREFAPESRAKEKAESSAGAVIDGTASGKG